MLTRAWGHQPPTNVRKSQCFKHEFKPCRSQSRVRGKPLALKWRGVVPASKYHARNLNSVKATLKSTTKLLVVREQWTQAFEILKDRAVIFFSCGSLFEISNGYQFTRE